MFRKVTVAVPNNIVPNSKKAKTDFKDEENHKDKTRRMSLTGLWSDGADMNRVYITLAPTLDAYTVLETRESKSNGKTVLSWLREDIYTNEIIISAPWGMNGQMRVYEGLVEPNGTKITWWGERGNVEWFKIAN